MCIDIVIDRYRVNPTCGFIGGDRCYEASTDSIAVAAWCIHSWTRCRRNTGGGIQAGYRRGSVGVLDGIDTTQLAQIAL